MSQITYLFLWHLLRHFYAIFIRSLVLFANIYPLITAISLCRVGAELCAGVVLKCLNASRAKTKEKGIETFMLVIEAEKQDIAQVDHYYKMPNSFSFFGGNLRGQSLSRAMSRFTILRPDIART